MAENDVERAPDAKIYYCYWITSGARSYIGATVDPTKRLRQHCGDLVGGARRTRGRTWKFECVISGFRTWKEALQFEWSFKYHSKQCRSVASRKEALTALLARERWTSNAPLASDVPLALEWQPTQYGDSAEFESKASGGTATNARRTRTRGFKKTLHGVTY